MKIVGFDRQVVGKVLVFIVLSQVSLAPVAYGGDGDADLPCTRGSTDNSVCRRAESLRRDSKEATSRIASDDRCKGPLPAEVRPLVQNAMLELFKFKEADQNQERAIEILRKKLVSSLAKDKKGKKQV